MLQDRTMLSELDRERLTRTVAQARSAVWEFVPHLDLFVARLRRAQVLPATEVPADLITMDSCFTIRDPDTGKEGRYTLVYPQFSSRPGGAPAECGPSLLWGRTLSVLTPMGMAMLGSRVGDEVAWMASDGPCTAVVEQLVYQPESWARGPVDAALVHQSSDPAARPEPAGATVKC